MEENPHKGVSRHLSRLNPQDDLVHPMMPTRDGEAFLSAGVSAHGVIEPELKEVLIAQLRDPFGLLGKETMSSASDLPGKLTGWDLANLRIELFDGRRSGIAGSPEWPSLLVSPGDTAKNCLG
jgi:hypothetical protein